MNQSNSNKFDLEHGSVEDDNELGNSNKSDNSIYFDDLLSTDSDNNSCSSSSSSSSSGLFEDDFLDELLDDTFDPRTVCTSVLAKQQRNFKWRQKKLCWDEHVAKLHHERQFSRTYRMSYKAFCKLHKILHPFLVPGLHKVHNQSNKDKIIYPELVMAIGLRWVEVAPTSTFNMLTFAAFASALC